jgi:hypothetical protein
MPACHLPAGDDYILSIQEGIYEMLPQHVQIVQHRLLVT